VGPLVVIVLHHRDHHRTQLRPIHP